MRLSATFIQEDFLSHSKKIESARGRIRCIGMHHLQKMKKLKLVGELMGRQGRTIGNWYKKYEEGGIDKLCFDDLKGGPCPKIILDKNKFQSLVTNLQDEKKGGRIDANDIRYKVKEEFGVLYSRKNIYKLLHKNKMSWITSRSKHPKSDLEAQEEYKKNSTIKLNQ